MQSLHFWGKILKEKKIFPFFKKSSSFTELTHGIVVNVLDYNIIVSEFKLQSYYYVLHWTNTLEKSMNFLISPAPE